MTSAALKTSTGIPGAPPAYTPADTVSLSLLIPPCCFPGTRTTLPTSSTRRRRASGFSSHARTGSTSLEPSSSAWWVGNEAYLLSCVDWPPHRRRETWNSYCVNFSTFTPQSIGYRFIESTTGACNGVMINPGADCCANASVLVRIGFVVARGVVVYIASACVAVFRSRMLTRGDSLSSTVSEPSIASALDSMGCKTLSIDLPATPSAPP